MEILLEGQDLKKSFGRRTVFSRIHFTLRAHDGLAIVGRNGSGKSTLAKIISGLLSPTEGKIDLTIHGKTIDAAGRHQYIGFVAPYLQLYDEFSGLENLDLFRKIRGNSFSDERLTEHLKRVNLFDRKESFVRTYSDGMKQRLKYASALLHEPPILILDEPTTSLDDEGMKIVRDILKQQRERGILIVATNERRDLEFCNHTIDLDVHNNSIEKMKR